jgi:hypothetical protein
MREVEINAAETDSLVGMGLLEDYKLEVEARPNGEVRITPLPALPQTRDNNPVARRSYGVSSLSSRGC